MEKRRLVTVLFWMLLTVVAVLSSVFYAIPALKKEESEKKAEVCTVRIWNIDTFEGGKGSRTAFLKTAALSCKNANLSVFYLVSSYTAEGAQAAMRAGNYPDAISFGVGFSPPMERCVSLRGYDFFGGSAGGAQLAVPWCKGGYILYSQSGNFERATAENTVVSVGGENLVSVAACLEGFAGAKSEESTSAYVRFLGGTYEYLLGTQRDACRFEARGVSVQGKCLLAYNDLYQYFSILTADEREREACTAFLQTLLSPQTQRQLSMIGMASVYGESYTAANGLQFDLERAQASRTVSPFSDAAALEKIREAAKAGNAEVLKKFLKSR